MVSIKRLLIKAAAFVLKASSPAALGSLKSLPTPTRP
jgi:hypothetical protein